MASSSGSSRLSLRPTAPLLLSLAVRVSLALDNGVGDVPAMGWNSWNQFRCEISEDLIREVARAMVSSGLRDAGYRYVNVDDCWQSHRRSDGHIVPSAQKFPSGMRALGDYIHGLGLKFGIYSDAAKLTCESFPGSMHHERKDAADYASWGVDYLKYDYCHMQDAKKPVRHYYQKMRDALNATGRPIHFNICSWGEGDPHLWGRLVGNSWRTGRDVFAVWDEQTARNELRLPALLQSIETAIEGQAKFGKYAGPGGFNDPDMLVVGLDSMSAYGQVVKCPPHLEGIPTACVSAGERPPLPNAEPMPSGSFVTRKLWGQVGGLSTTEQRTVFSFWSMLAAPLILGNDPRRMKRSTVEILTAPELIAISQDRLGHQAVRVWRRGGPTKRVQLWRKDLAHEQVAVMVYNGGLNTTDVPLYWSRDLPKAASKWQRMGPRQPPCVDRRYDCASFGPFACLIYLQNVSYMERKSDCMKTCNACQPARVRKGKHAVALVRNAWEREYEGVFQEEFIVRRVEAHEARVYVLRFERQEDGPQMLKKLANQAVKDMSDATERGHLVELDEVRERVKQLERRSEDLKRMLRNTGTGLTPLVEGCVDDWTERFPEQALDRDGRSCFWKHKWGQCGTFAAHCARTCGTCKPERRTNIPGRGGEAAAGTKRGAGRAGGRNGTLGRLRAGGGRGRGRGASRVSTAPV